jgi:hypothetical protein
MALIYRRSSRKIVRKVPASQMQAGRCNNCLIRSGKFGISMAVQKSLIPRVQFWVTSKVAHAARQSQMQVSGRAKVRAGPGRRAMARARSGQMQLPGSRPSFLAGIVFGGLSPEALSWQCLPGKGQFPGAHGLVRGIPCAGSTFPGAGLPSRVCHCWGGHCWAGLPTEGPPVAELAQVSADLVVNRTVPMGLASVH